MKSETSRNILLIALAVRLQRLVKNLPNHHISAERISKKSLAESYLSDGLSSSEDGARKKASRYMDEVEKVFGLEGTESTGFVMDKKFESFRDMFAYWLEEISPPEKSDKRLHVMLNGLLHAIDNAFSEDPIVIPNLAKQLKEKYANRNIRDTKEPLNELFDHCIIGSWLQLIEADDGAIGIDATYDPLLLRLKGRYEVGCNQDETINLARPGCVHVVFNHTIKDLESNQKDTLEIIAEHVCNASIWQVNNEDILPCLLFREGKQGPIMLTVRNLMQDQYEDLCVDDWSSVPEATKNYTPLDIDEKTWGSFKQLIRC